MESLAASSDAAIFCLCNQKNLDLNLSEDDNQNVRRHPFWLWLAAQSAASPVQNKGKWGGGTPVSLAVALSQ